MSIEIRTPYFVPEFYFIFLFFWYAKIFDRRKFENFVQKSTSEKSKASKNRRWRAKIGLWKP